MKRLSVRIKPFGRILSVALLWMLVMVGAASAAELGADDGPGARRFALLVAANDGGSERVTLRYAATDAQALSDVLVGLGGVRTADQQIVVDPTPHELDQAIAQMGQKIAAHRGRNGRAEFIFYYSGHSDERGLLLADAEVSYAGLRARLDQLDADVRLVILDSCASGSFTRTKGGRRMPSFLDDSANQISGYAVLASSSEDEVAQESDAIGGSFFTHYLISGLRGAADSSGNGRVTLNEAYRYAFDQTLARTHQSLGGAQHARYDIQMSGHGELVLTDLKDTSARLELDAEISGRVWVRDQAGRLMAEVPKFSGRALGLGVAPGTYRLEWASGEELYAAEKTVARGERALVGRDDFSQVEREQTRSRGGERDEEPAIGFGVDLLPRVGTSSVNADSPRVFSLNLIGGMSGGTQALELGGALNLDRGRVDGAQIAGALNYAEGLFGAQIAGAANINRGESEGAQIAGALNTASYVNGSQIAGALNIAEYSNGSQIAGALNYAGEGVYGSQVGGALNFSGGDTEGLQLAGATNYTDGSVVGAQIVGALNLAAGSVRGLQLGAVNIAGERVDGLQLGVVNVSDSSSASIGVINVFRDGYVQPEVFIADDGLVMAGIRHGSGSFYSLYHIGTRLFSEEDPPLAYGLGFGWRGAISDKLEFSSDLNVMQVVNGFKPWQVESVVKLRPMLGWKLSESVTIFGGPTLSLVMGEAGEGGSRVDEYARVIGWKLTSDTSRVDVGLWPGLTLGARFF